VGTGRGRVRIEKQAVKGKDPKWRPVVREGETALCWSKEREPFDGRDQSIVFQVAVPFFKLLQKEFPGFA
jgi:hypothetical protein